MINLLIKINFTKNVMLKFNYLYRLIFEEAVRGDKEAAQSTCAEDFFESRF